MLDIARPIVADGMVPVVGVESVGGGGGGPSVTSREITINSAYIDADVSNLLTWVPLWGVANVAAGAAGGRLAVKDSGGSVIPFYPTRHNVILRDGSWSWFSGPVSIMTSGGKLITGGVTGGGSNDAIVVSSIDTTTGIVQSSTIAGYAQDGDDHNNPALLELPSGHILIAYPPHGTFTDCKFRISTSAGDISSWNTERSVAGGTADGWSYANLFYLSGVGTGGTLFLIYRQFNSGTPSWYMRSAVYGDGAGSADVNVAAGTITWGSEVQVFTSGPGYYPYLVLDDNGTDRIDALISVGHPNVAHNAAICHCYFDGTTWHRTGGASLTLPITVASHLQGTDSEVMAYDDALDRSGTQVDDMWVWDVHRRADGTVQAGMVRWNGTSITDPVYYVGRSASGGAWSVESTGYSASRVTLPGTTAEVYYTGGLCIDRRTDNTYYIVVPAGGETESPVTSTYSVLGKATKSGSWSYEELWSASNQKILRPLPVKGHPLDGSVGAEIVFQMSEKYDNYTPYLDRETSGILGYPVLREHAGVWVRIPTVTAAGGAVLTLEYGDGVTPGQESRVNTFQDLAWDVLTGQGQDTHCDAPSLSLPGDGDAHITRQTLAGNWSFPVPDSIWVNAVRPITGLTSWLDVDGFATTPWTAGLAELTVLSLLEYDSSGADEHSLLSAWVTGGQWLLLRLEPASPADSMEMFIFDNSTTQQGGAITGAGAIPANTVSLISSMYDSDGDGGNQLLKGRVNGVVGASITPGNANGPLRSIGTATGLRIGLSNGATDRFFGVLGPQLAFAAALSDAYIDAIYHSWVESDFYSIGAES